MFFKFVRERKYKNLHQKLLKTFGVDGDQDSSILLMGYLQSVEYWASTEWAYVRNAFLLNEETMTTCLETVKSMRDEFHIKPGSSVVSTLITKERGG